ncbi:DgyrCDS2942 [Dimorphilus gyrociliatus]|uniref:DgyrCDS2942 n=1 Tax=Dimorphilus gyrociliatus TaxID=2664684 RepID=A0A7I8VDI0_9ANNE|nr:DgyrCDS2942 [Dimorphilus gyrociliatus]
MKALLRNILTFSLLLQTINAICNKVQREDVFYKPESVSFTLDCPRGSTIQFVEAKLYRDNCQLADALSYMRRACFLSDICATGLDLFQYNTTACPSSPNDSELRLKWFCEPKLGSVGTISKDFCTDTVSNQGYYFMLTSTTYIETKCMCRMTVPANHEVVVQFTASTKPGEFDDCKNHLLIGEDSSSPTKVCSRDSVSIPCQDKEKTLYFAVEKIGGKIYYNAEISVNDTSPNQLEVICGLRAPIPARQTTTSNFEPTTNSKTTTSEQETTTKLNEQETTAKPSVQETTQKIVDTTRGEVSTRSNKQTTAEMNSPDFISISRWFGTTLPPPAGSEDDNSDDDIIPIIIGICVGIAALILLVTLIALLLRYRSDSKKKAHQSMENLTTVEKLQSKSFKPPN